MPKVQEGEVIKLKETVTVYATDKHKHAEAGAKLTMHPKLAEYLSKKGWVTSDAKKSGKKD